MYRKIVNPLTGRKVNLLGKLGQSILRNYIDALYGGGDKRALKKKMALQTGKRKDILAAKRKKLRNEAAEKRRREKAILVVATPNSIDRLSASVPAYMKYRKQADTVADIDTLIRDAQTSLQPRAGGEPPIVRITLVWPDSNYASETPNYPHQAHSFAITCSSTHCLVYDNSGADKYYSDPSSMPAATNYKHVIHELVQGRRLYFFPKVELWTKPQSSVCQAEKQLKQDVFKCNKIVSADEGGCLAYVEKLVSNGFLQSLPFQKIFEPDKSSIQMVPSYADATGFHPGTLVANCV